MRKLLALLVVLFGCLTSVGQAVASASAGYSDCCLQGCKGMVHCASATCQACAAPQPAPVPEQPAGAEAGGPAWNAVEMPFQAGLQSEPWTPPD